MDVASLLVKIGFRADSKPLEGIQARLDGINSKLRLLAGAEVIKALYHMTEGFGHSALELENVAAGAGLTTEAMQKLQFAVAQSGGNVGELGMTLSHLARMLQQAKLGGDEAISTFYQLGISQQQIASYKTTEDALYGVMDALGRIRDPIKQHALLDRALGQGSRGLGRFALAGSAAAKSAQSMAARMGAVVPGSTIRQLANAKASLDGLGQIFRSVASSIGGLFAPVVIEVVHAIENFYQANRKVIAQSLEDWVVAASGALGYFVGVVETVGGAMLRFAGRHSELIRTAIKAAGAFYLVSAGIKGIAEAAGALKSAWGGVSAIFAAAPYIGMALAVGLAVGAIHDLWDLLHGGNIEDGWLAKTFRMIGDFTSTGAIGALIQNGIGKVSGALSNSQGAHVLFPQLFPEVSGTMPNAMANMAALTGSTVPPSIAAPSMVSNSRQANVTIQSPVTVNVPPGMSIADAKEAVATGIRDSRANDVLQAMQRINDPFAY